MSHCQRPALAASIPERFERDDDDDDDSDDDDTAAPTPQLTQGETTL